MSKLMKLSRATAAVGALAIVLVGCTTAKPMAPQAMPAPAPAAQPVAPAPAPAPTHVIQEVHFEFDRSNLRPSASAILDQVADELRRNPSVRYEVGGHIDSVGSVSYNQGLSERRAEAVRAYLVSRGVSAGQLTTRGYSENSPVATNSTSEGRAMNRRVEIRPLS
jgi:OmpA-OmpF porin, OOP family